MSLSKEEYEVAERLGVGAKELDRCDCLQVAMEGLSPHLQPLLVELVERGETGDR